MVFYCVNLRLDMILLCYIFKFIVFIMCFISVISVYVSIIVVSFLLVKRSVFFVEILINLKIEFIASYVSVIFVFKYFIVFFIVV